MFPRGVFPTLIPPEMLVWCLYSAQDPTSPASHKPELESSGNLLQRNGNFILSGWRALFLTICLWCLVFLPVICPLKQYSGYAKKHQSAVTSLQEPMKSLCDYGTESGSSKLSHVGRQISYLECYHDELIHFHLRSSELGISLSSAFFIQLNE